MEWSQLGSHHSKREEREDAIAPFSTKEINRKATHLELLCIERGRPPLPFSLWPAKPPEDRRRGVGSGVEALKKEEVGGREFHFFGTLQMVCYWHLTYERRSTNLFFLPMKGTGETLLLLILYTRSKYLGVFMGVKFMK